MIFSALEILVGETQVGHLFRYGDIVRLNVSDSYASDADRPVLSLSLIAGDPEQARAFFLDRLNPALNSLGKGRLPCFFQNLLPEGLLRQQIVEERGCAADDHFEILAACGSDLPGNVYARPAKEEGLVETIVTQHNDALEVSVVDEPMEDGASLSGMQPKRALIRSGGRFVVARHLEGGHVIGKLPTTSYSLLPEVEHLSLNLARVAGVNACHATLQPMSLIDDDRVGGGGAEEFFLAVDRFDRDHPGRVHAEDFAQVLSVDPGNKYTGGTYADIALVLMAFPDLGSNAVKELVRRLAVSELIGNYDFHLKNIGLLHHAGGRVELSPAYDIVAYSAYLNGRGNALPYVAGLGKRQTLDPKTLRAFAAEVGVPEAPLRKVVKEVCELALRYWPALIETSGVSAEQKKRIWDFIESRPMMESLVKRQNRVAARPVDDV